MNVKAKKPFWDRTGVAIAGSYDLCSTGGSSHKPHPFGQLGCHPQTIGDLHTVAAWANSAVTVGDLSTAGRRHRRGLEPEVCEKVAMLLN